MADGIPLLLLVCNTEICSRLGLRLEKNSIQNPPCTCHQQGSEWSGGGQGSWESGSNVCST